MSVLVDSTVWSLALRRPRHRLKHAEQRVVARWTELVRGGNAAIIGLVRQEVLSGVRDKALFERIRSILSAFPSEHFTDEDDVRAAEFYNRLQSAGVAASPVDMGLCSVANRLNIPIFTTDRDFELYARHVPIQLEKS